MDTIRKLTNFVFPEIVYGNEDKRMNQHFTGKGSKVTQKFEPESAEELEKVPGYFAKEVEQMYTEEYIA